MIEYRNPDPTALITSARIAERGAHDGLVLWNRGAQAGTLVLQRGDAAKLVEGLALLQVEASDLPAIRMGTIVYTDGASKLPSGRVMFALVQHSRGKWGIVDDDEADDYHDKRMNDEAALIDARVHAAWPIDPSKPSLAGHNTFWLITEGHGADRRTTVLLPDEY